MNEVRIVGNDLIISVDEVTETIENAALIEDNKRLQAENAKLRELVRDLYDHAAFSIDYFGDAHGILPRMRELGIEVDE